MSQQLIQAIWKEKVIGTQIRTLERGVSYTKSLGTKLINFTKLSWAESLKIKLWIKI